MKAESFDTHHDIFHDENFQPQTADFWPVGDINVSVPGKIRAVYPD
jgi:hypothetical protein